MRGASHGRHSGAASVRCGCTKNCVKNEGCAGLGHSAHQVRAAQAGAALPCRCAARGGVVFVMFSEQIVQRVVLESEFVASCLGHTDSYCQQRSI
eukprot:169155-Pleurochrysis_carterae.AAC.3